MDEETKSRIADYFEPWELVEYLKPNISTEDIIEAFEYEVENALGDIEELIEFSRG